MLTSLFGDLGLARTSESDPVSRPADSVASDAGFAARALVESSTAKLSPSGQVVDRHVRDLFVSGSPGQAMREHFAAAPAADASTHDITLFDPSQIWARGVIKTLSDASGQPIERLNLRDHVGLRTLGTIERTAIRRLDETLKIYHADLGPAAQGSYEIPLALMERSELALVIVGQMAPNTIDAMLATLREAAEKPTWRCPTLMFLLPPGAIWMANKVAGLAWPEQLRVRLLNESLTSASAVWNALLGVWNTVKSVSAPEPVNVATHRGDVDVRLGDGFPIRVADLPGAMSGELSTPSAARSAWPPLVAPSIDKRAARRALAGLLLTEGILGFVLVDVATDTVVAREQTENAEIDLDAAAAACGPILRAHRIANRSMGITDRLDELTVASGSRLQIVSAVPNRPGHVLLALFDAQRVGLALARFRVTEAAQNLA